MGERKIPLGAGATMIAWALMFDLFNLLVVTPFTLGFLDWVVDFFEWMIFQHWFAKYDASLWSRNPGLTIAAIVVDAVPLGDICFPWTWRVTYGVFNERQET